MTQMEVDSPGRTGWGSGRRRGLVEGEAGMRQRETWRSRRSSRSSVRRFGGESVARTRIHLNRAATAQDTKMQMHTTL
ncbi:hypothetical protein E2562_037179 [Oryza meyeriana var. granulata]|uniref:Uncharacterized protein n=1 Tax=Oryza meyeriana var. granulata TaxID=110450 RepID=A0A6G1DB86_9ORYZ|nr:hypothetical protein E2562_037179 [Oryza meyeriana var. granulata]